MAPAGRAPVAVSLRRTAESLPPGSFALVMATGIVSLAASSAGWQGIASALFQLNKAAYAALACLVVLRVAWYWPGVLRDMADHARGAGFFTMVAGTCLLGMQYLVLDRNPHAALRLWALGAGLWIVLTYTFPSAIVVPDSKPDVGRGLNGSWLLLTVATESVAGLGASVAPGLDGARVLMLFVTLVLYFVGAAMYAAVIALIVYRLLFVRLAPETLTPLYWVNMGAAAITALTGASIAAQASGWGFLHDVRPALDGLTLLAWGAATWWIPLLVVLGIWRHLIRRVAIRYDPEYWGLVFPLGMYSQATLALGGMTGIAVLSKIARVFVDAAWLAWLATAAGLVLRAGGELAAKRGRSRPATRPGASAAER